MTSNILITMSAEDLRQMLSEVVDERLKNHSVMEEEKRKSEKVWLTSKDVCAMLSICPATLDNWVNKGKVTRRKVERRAYYDEAEIKRMMKG